MTRAWKDGRSRELKHKGKGPRETPRWRGGQDLEESAEESALPSATVRFRFRNRIQRGVWSAVRKARPPQAGSQSAEGMTHDYRFAAIVLILENDYFSCTQPAILTLLCGFN